MIALTICHNACLVYSMSLLTLAFVSLNQLIMFQNISLVHVLISVTKLHVAILTKYYYKRMYYMMMYSHEQTDLYNCCSTY